MRPALVVALVAALAPPAHAGNQDLYGFGARGPGLSGAAVAFARGYEAIWYNPAGLVEGGGRAFSFGFQSTSFDLSIDSPRPDELEGITDENTISGVTLGVNVILPLKGALEDRIALGLGLYFPTKTLLSAEIPRPFTPQFSLVTDRARSLSISAGIAVRITDWLRLGAGVRALAGLTGFIEVGPNELGRIGSNVEDELVARYTPLVGLTALPHETVAIGLAFRGALGGKFELPVNAELGASLPLEVPEIRIAGMAVYDPAQVALHLGWKPLSRLSVEAGVTWRRWSDFPLPIENTTVALPAQPEPDFEDTFAPRIGLESPWSIGAFQLTGRLGYAWEPTPVPDQTGRHTFLDSDRHVASAGFGFAYENDGFRIDLDLYGQVHLMAPRHAVKVLEGGDGVAATADPGFPWIGHEGTIASFGAFLGVQL